MKLPCDGIDHKVFFPNGCAFCISAQRMSTWREEWGGEPLPLQVVSKPLIPLDVLPCPYRSDQPIAYCGSCGDEKNAGKYDCEYFDQLVALYPRKGMLDCQSCTVRRKASTDHFIAKMPFYPSNRYSGRGVVISAGGRYLPGAYVAVKMLRHVGCDLPVEIWYSSDNGESPGIFQRELAGENVKWVDAKEFSGSMSSPKGYASKLFAVLHSSFEEVLLLDADCYPCDNPIKVFEDPSYQETGAAYWPDIENQADFRWTDWEIEQHGPNVGYETGQFVIHKKTAWQQLRLACWFDDQREWTYTIAHGDTGSHRAAWAKLKKTPTFYHFNYWWKGIGFVHNGPDGQPLFCHRVHGKFELDQKPIDGTGMPYEKEAIGYFQELSDSIKGINTETALGSKVRSRLDNMLKVDHRQLYDREEFIKHIPAYPEGKFAGRGCVMLGGGKYEASAFVSLQMLRLSGWEHPIELWYRSHEESRPTIAGLIPGVTIRDASEIRKDGGWQSKMIAIINSEFEEVLFLDADAYPVRSVDLCFEKAESGFMVWDDVVEGDGNIRWEYHGLEPDQSSGINGGHYVIKKKQTWEVLKLAEWIDSRSAYFYAHQYGDQDSVRAAMKRLGFVPDRVKRGKRLVQSGCYLQNGPEGPSGKTMFVHRHNNKFGEFGGGPRLVSSHPKEQDAWFFYNEFLRIKSNS